jgi:HEPN domain-containing protein
VQQRLRSTLSIRDFGLDFQEHVLIHYSRLQAWMENFGADNVVVSQLQGDIIAQLRALLSRLGIEIAADAGAAKALNPSISLLAAKALLALNAGEGKNTRRLRALLKDIKGEAFRLPESVLKRTAPLFRKEARYLVDALGMDKGWLLADTTGIDDDAFFKWSHEEVVELLRALNSAPEGSAGSDQ